MYRMRARSFFLSAGLALFSPLLAWPQSAPDGARQPADTQTKLTDAWFKLGDKDVDSLGVWFNSCERVDGGPAKLIEEKENLGRAGFAVKTTDISDNTGKIVEVNIETTDVLSGGSIVDHLYRGKERCEAAVKKSQADRTELQKQNNQRKADLEHKYK